MDTVKLDNWTIVAGGDGYQAPEVAVAAISGIVTGHPLHDDGKRVRISSPVQYENGTLTTYGGTRYRLGEPDPAYESAFPGAKQRLEKILMALCSGH